MGRGVMVLDVGCEFRNRSSILSESFNDNVLYCSSVYFFHFHLKQNTNSWTDPHSLSTDADHDILPVFCNMVKVTLTPESPFIEHQYIEAALVSLTARGLSELCTLIV